MNDLVNRQAVIDEVVNWLKDRMTDVKNGKPLTDRLKDLPSAQPQRKKGEWIYNSPLTMKCNQCGLVIKDWDWHRFKYCPNCCSDMRAERRTDG